MEKSRVKEILTGVMYFIAVLTGLTACFWCHWVIGLVGIFLLLVGYCLGIRSRAIKMMDEIKDVFVHNAPDAFKSFMEGKAFEVTIDSPETITVSAIEIDKTED